MILKEVKIENFKSIENCKINVDMGCKIFVGLSESGKTNLLHALSMLDDSVEIFKKYSKEGTRSNIPATVKFVLKMTEEEKTKFLEEIKKIIYSNKINKFIQKNDKNVKLESFLKYEYVYSVDIRAQKRGMRYYILNNGSDYTIDENHKLIYASDEKPVFIVPKGTEERIEIKENIIINTAEYDVLGDVFNDIEVEKLHEIFSLIGIDIAKNNIPNVLFWEYKDEYLLPGTISINEFVNNPDINIPLKYIFQLSGIENIKAEYDECIEMGESSFQNLLSSVSNEANKYLKQVWKSMPDNCGLELRENADNINIRIKDAKNSYLLDTRSDGFKRLITYMIMLSVKNKNSQLKNTLLLIDEPETKIDIPGQEYLKLELINIGKNNYVYYSTHSTAMIDTNKIDRHYIVAKEKECTKLEIANETNYDNAMTLYKALGMQVYAIINDKNLVFEGWTDTNVFKIALKKLSNSKQNKFKKLGITHVPGATKFREFAELWGLLAKDYYIISDADVVSTNQKAAFEKERFTGKWYKYDEFEIDRKIETCEDFYETRYIKTIAERYGKQHGFLVPINEERLNSREISNITVIEEWVKYNISDNSTVKEKIKEFKTILAEQVKKDDISSDYITMLEKIEMILEL